MTLNCILEKKEVTSLCQLVKGKWVCGWNANVEKWLGWLYNNHAGECPCFREIHTRIIKNDGVSTSATYSWVVHKKTINNYLLMYNTYNQIIYGEEREGRKKPANIKY